MKTKLISFLIPFMVILSIVMILASIVQAAPAGKITNIDGRADITVPGQPARPLSIGDTVNVGDVIRTKSAAKCEVTWVDGSVVRLAENSRLQVTEFMLEKEKRSVSFNLFHGKMQNIVISAEQLFGPKGASKYEVHTPTSVCGVRGTNFFIYHQAGISGAIFTEGQGYGYSKGKPDQVKTIASGQAMVVTSVNTAPVVKTATPAEINKMMKDTAVSEKKETKKSEDDKGKGDKSGAGKKDDAAVKGKTDSSGDTTKSSSASSSSGESKSASTTTDSTLSTSGTASATAGSTSSTSGTITATADSTSSTSGTVTAVSSASSLGSSLGSTSGATNLGGDSTMTSSGSSPVIGSSAGSGSSTGGITGGTTAGSGTTTTIPPLYVPPVQPVVPTPPVVVVTSPTLLFNSSISGDIYQTVKDTLHINSYQKPSVQPTAGYFDPLRYETAYLGSGPYVKYGWQMDSYEQRDPRTKNKFKTVFNYNSNNTYSGFMVNNGVPAIFFLGNTSTITSTSTNYSNIQLGNVWPDLSTSPPTTKHVSGGTTIIESANISNNAYPVNAPITVDPAQNQYFKVFSQTVPDFYVSERLQPDSATPAFQGDMAIYRKYGDPDTLNLWNATATQPLSLQLQGTHISFTGGAVMSAPAKSTTPDGGAYIGWFGNVITSDLSAKGFFAGLYVSPSGEAGFLRADSIIGTSDGVSSWSGTSDIYSVKKIDGSTVAANVLLQQDANGNYINLKGGFLGNDVNNGGTKGDFVSGGSIDAMGMIQGGTETIAGYPSWGMFITGMRGKGTFSNPSGATNWRADFAGYGTFGVYNNGFPDFGYWNMSVADVNHSIWNNNKISAAATGEFLTYTKQGTISGNFVGAYTGTTSGTWGVATGGTWEKTRDVAFSSGLSGKIYNLGTWIQGATGNYNYRINGNWTNGDITNSTVNIYANTSTNTISGMSTNTQYNWQGYSDATHDPAYTKTTWSYTQTGTSPNYSISGAQLVGASTFPSKTEYLAEINAMRSSTSETTGYDMSNTTDLNGIVAGFNNSTDNKNFWDNITALPQSTSQQSTSIALAGLYDAMNYKTPTLMAASFASFNPTVNTNPYSNSTSPIGGAYYGYLTAAFGKQTKDADTLDGNINAIYLNPNTGKLGILYGTFSGSNLPDIGSWKGSGNIKGFDIVTATGVTPANFVNLISTGTSEYRFLGTGVPATDYIAGYDSAGTGNSVIYTPIPEMGGSTSGKQAYALNENAGLSTSYYQGWTGGSFGIVKGVFGGTYDPTATPNYQSNYKFDYYSGGNLTATSYTASDWDNPSTTPNTIASNVHNGSVLHNGVFDPVKATGWVAVKVIYGTGTQIGGADIKGLFDPNKSTWQAVLNGTAIETTAFMNLVNSLTTQAQKEAFMSAMKIPCINVGQVDLSGSRGATGNSMSVNMQGVTFYAFSTGQVPRLFATKNITGNYDVTTLPANTLPQVMTLTPSNADNLSGVSAYFQPRVWDTTNHKWGGDVTGTGMMAAPATNIIFKGGAAGSLNGGTIGTFNGTGAGIVRTQ